MFFFFTVWPTPTNYFTSYTHFIAWLPLTYGVNKVGWNTRPSVVFFGVTAFTVKHCASTLNLALVCIDLVYGWQFGTFRPSSMIGSLRHPYLRLPLAVEDSDIHLWLAVRDISTFVYTWQFKTFSLSPIVGHSRHSNILPLPRFISLCYKSYYCHLTFLFFESCFFLCLWLSLLTCCVLYCIVAYSTAVLITVLALCVNVQFRHVRQRNFYDSDWLWQPSCARYSFRTTHWKSWYCITHWKSWCRTTL